MNLPIKDASTLHVDTSFAAPAPSRIRGVLLSRDIVAQRHVSGRR